jgi:hypothetical protein
MQAGSRNCSLVRIAGVSMDKHSVLKIGVPFESVTRGVAYVFDPADFVIRTDGVCRLILIRKWRG